MSEILKHLYTEASGSPIFMRFILMFWLPSTDIISVVLPSNFVGFVMSFVLFCSNMIPIMWYTRNIRLIALEEHGIDVDQGNP